MGMLSPQTLAEMIRLGSKETAQCTRRMFLDTEGKEIFLSPKSCSTHLVYNERAMSRVRHTCAMGAAALVATDPLAFLAEVSDKLQYEIMFKNDSLGWTREAIADWLEAL